MLRLEPIASGRPVTAVHGLSHTQNLGLAAATGEIVACLDDDAWPDPHWLSIQGGEV